MLKGEIILKILMLVLYIYIYIVTYDLADNKEYIIAVLSYKK